MARMTTGGGGRKRRPRPNATQRARAQQQSYVSQGRAVSRAATQQRRQSSSAARAVNRSAVAFRPISSQSKAFRPQVARATHKTRQALKRLPDHPAIPHVPVIGLPRRGPVAAIPVPLAIKALEHAAESRYSSAQVKRIHQLYSAGARKAGVRSITELFQLGSLRQRKNMIDVGRAIADLAQSKDVVARNQRDRVKPGVKRSGVAQGLATINDELAQRAAIPGTAAATGSTKTIGDLAVSGVKYGAVAPAATIFNLGRATVEDPGAVASSSARTAVESITGILQAVKQTISQVEQYGLAKGVGMTLEAMGKDYERRYGSILSDPAKFREQVKRDYGLTPFVFDAASVGASTGQLAGALARSGTAGRAAAALTRLADKHPNVGSRAAAGAARGLHDVTRPEGLQRRLAQLDERLSELRDYEAAGHPGGGKKWERVKAERDRVAAELDRVSRANLRWSAGEGGVRRQRSSSNLFTALGQRGLDRTRRNAYAKRVAHAGLRIAAEPGARVSIDGIRGSYRVARVNEDGRVVVNTPLGNHVVVDPERIHVHDGGRLVEPEAGGGRLPALRPGANEVLPKTTGVVGRSVRELPGLRSLTGRTARDIGGKQSVTRLRMLTTRGRVIADIEKRIKQLTPEERQALKYAEQLGVRSGPEGARALARRLEQMTKGREKAGMERVTPILADTNDEVRLLRQILAEPDKYLTPQLDRVASELRDIQIEHADRDPDLTAGREVIARHNPQADFLGIARGPDVNYFRGVLQRIEAKTEVPGLAARADELASLPPAERAGVAKDLVKAARGDRKTAERAVQSIDRRLAVANERLRIREHYGNQDARDRQTSVRELEQFRESLKGELMGARREHISVPGVTDGGDIHIAALREEIKATEEMIRETRAEGPRQAAIFNQRQLEQARVKRESLELEKAAAKVTLDGARQAEKALKKVLKASKSKTHMRLEHAESFVAKVRAAAEDAGLAEPAYWESAMRPPDSTAALSATGRGFRATARSKHRTGEIFEVGAEETSPDVFTRGVERNIKRRFQWALVQRNLETHAFEWSRGRNGEGLTAKEALKVFDERRIDPRSVELINANYVHRRPVDEAATVRGDTVLEQDAAGLGEQITGTGDMQAELAANRRRIEDVTAEAQSGQAMNRYYVVPKDVADTTAATLRATDNTAWRALEILLKQKPVRIMLGAVNVPWLAFQIASNALLTGLGGGVNPFNVYGAHKWWKSLEPDERDAVEAELGITHGHHLVGGDEPNLGATNNRMVAFWRAYKKSKVGRAGTKLNLLNVMFRADEAQNNFFRRVLFYDQARKQAYRRMGQSWKGIDRGISRLVDRVLAKPPGEQAQLIARHSEDFEKVAKHVNDFLGDYLRFSPAERFLLSRNVMFYGYLRFSLRFAFYTMPVKHPVMTNLLSNLGRLGAQEIKDLFGVPDNYRLPTSMLSQVYFGDRADAEAGKLRSLPLGRFNPFLNTLTQLDGMQQAVGLVSPIYQAFVDQAFQESSFTGRDWRIEGRPTPSEAERPKDYYGSAWSMFQPSIPNPLRPLGIGPAQLTEGSPRGRILQKQIFLNLAYPYRTAEQTVLEPNQSDDALLWQPHPMTYADPTAAAGVQASRDAQARRSIFERIGAKVLPVFPQVTAAPAVIAREREKEKAAAQRASRKPGERKRRRRSTSPSGRYGGGSSSTSSNYGGGSSSTASRYGG